MLKAGLAMVGAMEVEEAVEARLREPPAGRKAEADGAVATAAPMAVEELAVVAKVEAAQAAAASEVVARARVVPGVLVASVGARSRDCRVYKCR